MLCPGRCPLAEGHGHIYVRVSVQCRVDLTEFDAMPTNLDLTVGSPLVLDGEFWCPRSDVARAIQTITGPAVWVGNKSGCREHGLVVVSPRESRPGHVQFARRPDRHREESRVEDQSVENRARATRS